MTKAAINAEHAAALRFPRHDSVIVATLAAGAYTLTVRAKSAGPGFALVEVYDSVALEDSREGRPPVSAFPNKAVVQQAGS